MIERAVLLTRGDRIVDADLQVPGRKTKFARATPAMGTPVSELKVVPSPALTAKDTAPAVALGDTLDLRSALENLERELIDRALRKAGGNRTEAAALLGLNRTTLVEKLRKYAA